ncbi:MAG: type II toxin-antitoxin system Phd/YefM family antitoxin [Pseudomonadota bacterium]
MTSVNMLQAKSSLSRLVEAIEQGEEQEIIIARNGRPAARLVPLADAPSGPRIGVARGRFEVPDSIDAHNEEVARLFLGNAP